MPARSRPSFSRARPTWDRLTVVGGVRRAVPCGDVGGTHMAYTELVNDSLGHDVGDKLLQSVAQLLADCTRTRDTIGRQGGDEFIVVAPLDSHENGAAMAAEKILAQVAHAQSVEGR